MICLCRVYLHFASKVYTFGRRLVHALCEAYITWICVYEALDGAFTWSRYFFFFSFLFYF
ncbi:uncharacterized protein TRIVIDRAFT_213636 [Trichoderma virens Gv29-8]|uniref:Uncharacterized protein n=1 Tax=Hypocrea virens (strain Gv29-8 / FGSC 10586) TaxID=413071 RepID=G9N1N5_HYPVG|nr:uncharacterized protein TRIVIDRAFT_213636 [Trichoderma virens Gv29-8]EHK19665.1 hypothetical protein TRIVIDRAFT_213636 [Trichoderma virens Gv29-8]